MVEKPKSKAMGAVLVTDNKRDLNLPNLLRGREEREQYCCKVLEAAQRYLNRLIDPERRITYEPEINHIEGSVMGSYKIGSTSINVNSIGGMLIGVSDITAHEWFHLWQNADGLIERTEAFCAERPEIQDERARKIIRDTIVNAGAYFFTELFLYSVRERGSECYPIKKHMMLLCVDLLPDCRHNVFGSVCKSVGKDDLNKIVDIVFSSCRDAPENMAKVVAVLTFAANDYNARKTLNVLSSSPKEILDSINGMSRRKFGGLMRLAMDVAKDLRYDRAPVLTLKPDYAE